jgi:hypothetical protein
MQLVNSRVTLVKGGKQKYMVRNRPCPAPSGRADVCAKPATQA